MGTLESIIPFSQLTAYSNPPQELMGNVTKPWDQIYYSILQRHLLVAMGL